MNTRDTFFTQGFWLSTSRGPRPGQSSYKPYQSLLRKKCHKFSYLISFSLDRFTSSLPILPCPPSPLQGHALTPHLSIRSPQHKKIRKLTLIDLAFSSSSTGIFLLLYDGASEESSASSTGIYPKMTANCRLRTDSTNPTSKRVMYLTEECVNKPTGNIWHFSWSGNREWRVAIIHVPAGNWGDT